MTETVRTTTYRDPNSFNDLIVTEISHRTLLRGKMGDAIENLELHEPEVLTREEFLTELDGIGLVKTVEIYLDSDSLFEVTRGRIIRNGIEHFFHVMYPVGKLYKSYVTGAISAILYTKVVSNG